MSAHAAPLKTPAERDAILKDIAGKLPVRPNARKRMIWTACLVIGVVSFAWLLFSQPQRAWGVRRAPA